jgi:hypothetical protein
VHVAASILPFPVVHLRHFLPHGFQQRVAPGTVGTDPARQRHLEWQRRIEERQPLDPVGMQPSERLRDPSAEVVPDQAHGAYRRVIQQGDKISAEIDDVVAAGGLSESPNPRRSSQLTLFGEP